MPLTGPLTINMNESQINAPRPQVRKETSPVRQAVVAQPGHYTAAAPAIDGELAGLVHGLSALNPALARLGTVQAEHRAAEDAEKGRAYAQTVENPREAIAGGPIQAPTVLPSAVSDSFRMSMREQLAHRAAIGMKEAALTEFNTAKDSPDFDSKAWLVEQRKKALAGIADPSTVSIVGRHFNELDALVGAEVRRATLQKAEEVKHATLTQMAADMFTVDMGPAAITATYPRFVEEARRAGYSLKESAHLLFTQVSSMSNKRGGAPELFDVFERKDHEGLTLTARNPQLAPAIEQARKHARAQAERAMSDAAEQGNARVLMQLDDDIRERPETITPDRLVSLMTTHGPIRTPGQAAALYARAQEAHHGRLATQALAANFDNGTLFWLDPDEQSKVLDLRLGGTVQKLVQSVQAGDQQGIQTTAAMLLNAHSRSGATIPVPSVARLTKTLVSNLPNPQGATPTFKAAAELYKAMSADPTYRAMYFSEVASKVLEGYTKSIASGSDEKSAYVHAYQSVSPEANAAADAYVNSSDFQKKLTSDVRKYVEGSSWVPKLLGGNGRPQNTAAIGIAVADAVRNFRSSNPYATDEQAEEFVEKWTAQNFVLDTTTGNAVKVPPGMGGRAAQEAFSAYSKKVHDALKLGSRSEAEWSVQYIPAGTEGRFQVVAFNGMATQSLGTVSLDTLLTAERARRVLSREELRQLGAMREGMRAGKLADIPPELLAKAEALNAIKPAESKAYRAAAQKQLAERLQAVPRLSFGAPSFEGLQLDSKPVRVDNQLTGRVALEFAASPMFSPATQHQGLAASLIAMGEGVVLHAYEDPASGAGRNIGMGYNLKANEKNVHDDLKRAGVPPERVGDVLQGRAQLTTEQAKRLLQVSMPRYEKQVHDIAEATSPGLWARMTPAQKAVMIDVAWQTGTPEKFKKAWEAVAANDPTALTNETKVFCQRSA